MGYYFARFILWLGGWKVSVQIPDNIKKAVMIAAPHTSNWDFCLAMVFLSYSRVKGKFAIKKEWLKFPFKTFFTSLGAFGIDRGKSAGGKGLKVTDLLANILIEADEFVMVVAPEGTRKRNDKWKTGFYYTALKANVPIVLAYVDTPNKTMGTGLIIYPENYETDMVKIMDFYRDKSGINPDQFALDKRFTGEIADD
jgi:1-acyl-sn-glycerol-3-phosphate acyltransferase